MNGLAITIIVLVVAQLVTIFGFVLLDRRQPMATLAWVFAVLFLPFVGILLYLLVGAPRLVRRSRQLQRVEQRVEAMLERQGVAHDAYPAVRPADPRTVGFVRLGSKVAEAQASSGNACQILVNATATYRAMIAAMEAATKHIHVLFYIIQPDRTGRALRDRLVARANAGIEVRVLVDGVGSVALPPDFWRPLIEAGGHFAIFSPVGRWYRLWRRDRIDFRNHRKILVVDGKKGFTGGINVGQEYLGLNPELGHWRDTHIALEGPAVLDFQRIFVADWLAATAELLDDEGYFPDPRQVGAATVQVIDSGPDRTWSPIHKFYFAALTSATERAWITSPYFVPDAAIEEALVSAALRGVDVRLLLPSRSDSALVNAAARSYYPRLLEAGVRIYEYARGFVHAKTLVVDRWMATIGSANMDIRSFHLNYEVNAFVLDQVVADEMARVFLDDLADAKELTVQWVEELSYGRRLAHGFARLLSPLL